MSDLLIDAELEIEILGISPEGVNLSLKFRRNRAEGFREDMQRSLFNGVILKSEEYVALPTGSIIVLDGIKVPVKMGDGE